MVHPSIFANFSPSLRASPFRDGLDPGNPMQAGHTRVLGSALPSVGQEQNILDLVGS